MTHEKGDARWSMRLVGRLVLAVLLVAVMLPVGALPAMGADDDNVPGVSIPGSPFTGTLDEDDDMDDVYSVHLEAGQPITVVLEGPDDADFDLFLYGPNTTDVGVDSSEQSAYSSSSYEQLTYTASTAGTYYVDVYSSSGSGSYTVAWSYTLAWDVGAENIPGVPIPASPFTGIFDGSDSCDDVVAVELEAGQSITAALKGTDGAEFDLYLYGPGTTDVDSDPYETNSVNSGSVELLNYTARASGTYYLDIYISTGSGRYTVAWRIEDEESVLSVSPIEGLGRIETAIAASRDGFGDGSDYVIIATARKFPDALGGSALAGVLSAPILLTEPAALPECVAVEIVSNLGASNAIILGGEAAVSSAVESRLQELLGEDNVERISGDSRYETAENVAARVIQERESLSEPPYEHTAFVATGRKFADAVAASSFTTWGTFPVYLVNEETGPVEFANTLSAAGVSRVSILGGEVAVPLAIETAIEDAGILVIERFAGASRYETAALVAEAFSRCPAWDGEVAITTGTKFPDALAGGAALGARCVPILLTPPTTLDPAVRAYLANRGPYIDHLDFLGGLTSVNVPTRAAARTAIADMWGGSPLGISTFSAPGIDRFTSYAVTHEKPAERVEAPVGNK
ncbi:MAG: cell wall-binding repeat-containing protein [Coriobacteriia bacterium]|nr:cell wall-binding repeat-containing protein [Coriobacteriia bacterium]